MGLGGGYRVEESKELVKVQMWGGVGLCYTHIREYDEKLAVQY